MTFLANLIALFTSTALSIWTKVDTALTIIINEIPDDQVQILHDAMSAASNKLNEPGATDSDAFNAAELTWLGEEKTELNKVGQQLLAAFITATAAKTGAAT